MQASPLGVTTKKCFVRFRRKQDKKPKGWRRNRKRKKKKKNGSPSILYTLRKRKGRKRTWHTFSRAPWKKHAEHLSPFSKQESVTSNQVDKFTASSRLQLAACCSTHHQAMHHAFATRGEFGTASTMCRRSTCSTVRCILQRERIFDQPRRECGKPSG